MSSVQTILAIDVGSRRVGLALAREPSYIASPLKTLINDDNFMNDLSEIVSTNNVTQLVVGLPRGLDGQVTEQTKFTQRFTKAIQEHFDLPLTMQDEALTSVTAETELKSRGKLYSKEDIDALAASYILEDWMAEHLEK